MKLTISHHHLALWRPYRLAGRHLLRARLFETSSSQKRLLTQAVQALANNLREAKVPRAGFQKSILPEAHPVARIFFNRDKVDLRNIP